MRQATSPRRDARASASPPSSRYHSRPIPRASPHTTPLPAASKKETEKDRNTPFMQSRTLALALVSPPPSRRARLAVVCSYPCPALDCPYPPVRAPAYLLLLAFPIRMFVICSEEAEREQSWDSGAGRENERECTSPSRSSSRTSQLRRAGQSQGCASSAPSLVVLPARCTAPIRACTTPRVSATLRYCGYPATLYHSGFNNNEEIEKERQRTFQARAPSRAPSPRCARPAVACPRPARALLPFRSCLLPRARGRDEDDHGRRPTNQGGVPVSAAGRLVAGGAIVVVVRMLLP
ncbi:hypothetical protein B0H13DRAFT_2660037 [Mycena leptocephala]|nr:hypothetical protein B0H13DRAFT_2660037 [Mycena leptocephala]